MPVVLESPGGPSLRFGPIANVNWASSVDTLPVATADIMCTVCLSTPNGQGDIRIKRIKVC